MTIITEAEVAEDITFDVEFTADGRIVDYLDSSVLLEDRPEERIRQAFLRTLHLEYGHARDTMAREVTIFSGANAALDIDGQPIRADIVVYGSATARATHDQGNILFVVECKRPDVESGYAQLVSYIFNTSASGGIWTNGSDVQPYRRISVPNNSLERAPEIPRQGESWDAVGRRRREDLDRPRDVRGLLRLCHNKLHGRGIDGEEEDLAMDMVRIILAKAQDEIGTSSLPEFYCTSSEYLTATGRDAVAERVQRLFRTFADNNPGVFTPHERIGVSAGAITEVVAVLQRWSVMTKLEDADEWDIMGSAYEQYTAAHLKRQRGQFFTNRLLVDFMVRSLNPASDAKALDPAGGSGGFLTACLRHMRRKIIEEATSETAREHQLANLRQRLFMVEISPRLVKIAKTAMLLNGDGHSGMTRGDSLGPYENLDDWIKARCGRHQPEVILTNPPFAGVGEGQVTDPEVLSQYQLARRAGNGSGTVSDACPPEMLFFERCLDWLAPGGQLGIVMPKGFLDTSTYLPARKLLFKEAQLLGVVTCHKNTFQPDTGVRTCVLFMKKKSGTETDDSYPIFMGMSRKIGRDSEGKPIFKLDTNGEVTDDIDADLDELLADFRATQEGDLVPSTYRFSIHRDEIGIDLNINPQYHLPHLNDSLRSIQRLDDVEGWTVSTIGQLHESIRIFKGPRLRTENLIVDSENVGPMVEPYYTPSALLQQRRDSVKFLDLSRANRRQLKAFESVRVRTGDILVTRSGSIGRVAVVTPELDGAIVSDDVIRVRIPDLTLRGYVFGYLQTSSAQNQLLRNEYGTIQQHLEPVHVADVLIPIPDDRSVLEHLSGAGETVISLQTQGEKSTLEMSKAWSALIESVVD